MVLVLLDLLHIIANSSRKGKVNVKGNGKIFVFRARGVRYKVRLDKVRSIQQFVLQAAHRYRNSRAIWDHTVLPAFTPAN